MKLRLLVFALLTAFVLPSLGARAEDTSGTITGSVHSASGVPVPGALIVLSGPVHQQTDSDVSGTFRFTNVPQGLYRLDISKGGYLATSETDLTVASSAPVPVEVTLQRADLTSLNTIAHVTTSARSSINTGAAAIAIAGRQQFANLAAPQINDVVQRIPSAVVQHGSSSPNTSISLAGSQGYETQVLLDGHPLSAGRYGVWFSQFFNSFLVGNIETEIGPGNTTPFAGMAVGGTANIVTPGYTSKPTYEFTSGIDSYDSQYSNFLDTGKYGKLSYVVAGGYNGDNRKYFGTYGCIIDPSNKSKWNTPGATGVIQFCGDLGGPQMSKGELLKTRWDFSPTTSLELGYVGSQGGYIPQGSAYGVNTGPITIVSCITPTHCTNPGYSGMVGQTINGYFFYPGSKVYNNQPLFTAQLRTAIGNNTLLVRPYAGNISRIIDGSGESSFPNYWYPSSMPASTCNNRTNTGPTINGLTACNNTQFSVLESDKLKGGTLSFIHPMVQSEITGTYDYHSDETYAYYNDPSNVAVPDTTARFHTLSLTGGFDLGSNVTLKAGAYETIWNLAGWQTGPFTTVNGSVKATTVPLSRTVSRFDPHLAFTFQPSYGTSLRLSAGTSTTFPYASQVSGLSVYTPASGTGGVASLTQKNPGLQPEHAVEFGLGLDKRLHDGTIVSIDLVNTQLNNVFETVSSIPNPQPTPPAPVYSVLYQPVNAAKLSSQMAMLTFRKEPIRGLGYYLSGSLARSVPTGIPIQSKGFSVPANGIQQCSDGGSAVCIPFFKGYGALSYTTVDGTYFKAGVDFEGKNNTYFQPPFAIFDLTVRRPITKEFDVQIAASNLLNTNSFSGLVTPNAGVPMTGQNGAGQYGNYTQALPFPLIPVQPRTVRLQFRYHVGRE